MDKLVKLLALAASDKDAEALAALRAASKLLKELNIDWNDVAQFVGKAAGEIVKKREAEKRSEQRARFKASPQGKIAAYRRCMRAHKKALKEGDEMKVWLWQMRADNALEDMDATTRGRLVQLDRLRDAARVGATTSVIQSILTRQLSPAAISASRVASRGKAVPDRGRLALGELRPAA